MAGRDFHFHGVSWGDDEKYLEAKVDRMDKPSGEWKPLAVEAQNVAAIVKVPLEEGGGELLRVK